MNRVVSVHESGREETEKEDGVILRQSEKIVSTGTFRDAVSPASARIQPLPIRAAGDAVARAAGGVDVSPTVHMR